LDLSRCEAVHTHPQLFNFVAKAGLSPTFALKHPPRPSIGRNPRLSAARPKRAPMPEPTQPQPLRLPPVQDRLHDVGRQAGEREEPADVGVRDALLLRKVGDRLRLAALNSTSPAVRSKQRNRAIHGDESGSTRRHTQPDCQRINQRRQTSAGKPLDGSSPAVLSLQNREQRSTIDELNSVARRQSNGLGRKDARCHQKPARLRIVALREIRKRA
jgi:hypothetical protein